MFEPALQLLPILFLYSIHLTNAEFLEINCEITGFRSWSFGRFADLIIAFRSSQSVRAFSTYLLPKETLRLDGSEVKFRVWCALNWIRISFYSTSCMYENSNCTFFPRSLLGDYCSVGEWLTWWFVIWLFVNFANLFVSLSSNSISSLCSSFQFFFAIPINCTNSQWRNFKNGPLFPILP